MSKNDNQFAWNEIIQKLNEMEKNKNIDIIQSQQQTTKRNVSEICLEIDDIVKKQAIPLEIYKQINSLLCDIIRINNGNIYM